MKKRNKFLKAAAICLTMAVLLLSVSISALASVPSRPENQYVLDSAGVISDATEQLIISENKSLFKESGGEIVIAAVDFLGGQEIDDYVYDMFNSWGIGSKERNNGILLVLAIGEDNYYAQAGYGIEDHFNGALMQELLDDFLEDDFAKGDYDAGVKKFFNAALSELKAYDYNDEYDVTDYQQGGAYENYGGYEHTESSGIFDILITLISFVIRIVIIVVVIIVIISIIRSISNNGGGGSSGGSGGGGFWTGMFIGSRMNRRNRWHNPPPPPPPPHGGFGGPAPRPPRSGGFGGGRPGGFSGGGRSSRPSGGGRSGGFSGGGGSRGGGAGRR